MKTHKWGYSWIGNKIEFGNLENMYWKSFDFFSGLEQYAVQRFGQALHVVPKMLAENTGVKANVVIAELAAAHAEGKTYAGKNFFTM